jgi:hypothetical protein
MNEPAPPHAETLNQLADTARTKLTHEFGEGSFARLCMKFDQSIENVASKAGVVTEEASALAGEVTVTTASACYLKLLILLADQPDALNTQLALIWLDGHGWGKMTLVTLAALISGVRDVYKIDGSGGG